MAERKIRVAYVIDSLEDDTSGTEKQLLETLRRLDRKRIEPFLVCLTETDWLRHHSTPCPTLVLGYRALLSPSMLGVVRRLRTFIAENRVDVVQTFFEDSIFATWSALARRAERPVLLSSRRDIGLGLGVPWHHTLYDRFRPFVLADFDGVVANADAARRYTVEQDRVPSDRVTVVRNGINLDMQEKPSPEVFHKADADLWIVLAANFNPVKRHKLFIDSLALLRRRCPRLSFHALLLGEGPTEVSIREHAAAEGLADCIHMEGSVADVGAYLAHADIGVLCSYREGLSNSILEYMKYGLPVVATDVGGNGELVDKDNGSLVPSGDADAMARALADLANDTELRQQKGAVSRGRVEQLCSWDRTLNSLEDVYRRHLEQRQQ